MVDFRSLPVGAHVRYAHCAYPERNARWLGFVGDDAFIWWPEGGGWRLGVSRPMDVPLRTRLQALGLDPNHYGCWAVAPTGDGLTVIDAQDPRPPKYPHECPCGMPARICDYHKDM